MQDGYSSCAVATSSWRRIGQWARPQNQTTGLCIEGSVVRGLATFCEVVWAQVWSYRGIRTWLDALPRLVLCMGIGWLSWIWVRIFSAGTTLSDGYKFRWSIQMTKTTKFSSARYVLTTSGIVPTLGGVFFTSIVRWKNSVCLSGECSAPGPWTHYFFSRLLGHVGSWLQVTPMLSATKGYDDWRFSGTFNISLLRLRAFEHTGKFVWEEIYSIRVVPDEPESQRVDVEVDLLQLSASVSR